MRNATEVATGIVQVKRAKQLSVAIALACAASLIFAGASEAQRGGGRGRGGIRVMTLTSPAFTDGGAIPIKHTQPGRDVSPPLAWSGAPDSTVSFVLIVHDADAAAGDGTDDLLHWLVWNIPGSATSLPEGVMQGPQIAMPGTAQAPAGRGGGPPGLRQISVSGPYYRGPAAPATGPAHHYIFELYALDTMINVQPVGMTPAATRAAVLDAMKTHIRARPCSLERSGARRRMLRESVDSHAKNSLHELGRISAAVNSGAVESYAVAGEVVANTDHTAEARIDPAEGAGFTGQAIAGTTAQEEAGTFSWIDLDNRSERHRQIAAAVHDTTALNCDRSDPEMCGHTEPDVAIQRSAHREGARETARAVVAFCAGEKATAEAEVSPEAGAFLYLG
jgi:Raf kinase inhibitor-like YbhB/YbcL family protein